MDLTSHWLQKVKDNPKQYKIVLENNSINVEDTKKEIDTLVVGADKISITKLLSDLGYDIEYL